jgi:hypothetical protein
MHSTGLCIKTTPIRSGSTALDTLFFGNWRPSRGPSIRLPHSVLPKGNVRIPFVILETLLPLLALVVYQHHAISDTARGDFLLCSGSPGNRIHVLRMEIRVRAFESCCAPAADGLDCLSSAVIRTKRGVMQSGQVIQCPFLQIRRRRPLMSKHVTISPNEVADRSSEEPQQLD